jgi:adenosylcobinamide-GDP ribazoletransferase
MDANDSPPPDFDAAIGDFRAALAFLTRIPAGWLGVAPDARPDFRRASGIFPLVGCVVGAAGGGVMLAAGAIGVPPLASAVLAVTATMALTGGLHEDGLADTADSFGGATAERRLEIMDDSRIGSFGAAALAVSLLLRVACLTALAVYGLWTAALTLVIAEGISRAAPVRMWHDLPPARLSGLAHDAGPPGNFAMLLALAMAGVLALLAIPVVGLRPAVLAAVLAALAAYVCMRLTGQALGGRTGDTLGACQQVALLAYLVGAATL